MLTCFVLKDEWGHMEEIQLVNDGSGLGFGIVGGKMDGVVVRTLVPNSVADRVSTFVGLGVSLRFDTCVMSDCVAVQISVVVVVVAIH